MKAPAHKLKKYETKYFFDNKTVGCNSNIIFTPLNDDLFSSICWSVVGRLLSPILTSQNRDSTRKYLL